MLLRCQLCFQVCGAHGEQNSQSHVFRQLVSSALSVTLFKISQGFDGVREVVCFGSFRRRQDLPAVVKTPPSPLFQTWFSFSSSDNFLCFSFRPRDQEMSQFLVHLICHMLKVRHRNRLLLILRGLHRLLQRCMHYADEVSCKIRPDSPTRSVLLSERSGIRVFCSTSQTRDLVSA